MAKYLITYDLVGTSETSADYKRLIKQIETYADWGKLQKSVWLVKSNKTSSEVFDDLAGAMDANDRLAVLAITGTAAWHIEICDRPWLENFLNS